VAVIDGGRVVTVSRQMKMNANVDSNDIVNVVTVRQCSTSRGDC
jgi:hypothetical protein